MIKSSSRLGKGIIISVYRPPSASREWFIRFNTLVVDLLPMGDLIILGDINANLFAPSAYPGSELLATLAMSQTKVPKIFPTRITDHSQTCIDIIAIPATFDCIRYEPFYNCASDHLPVTAQLKFKHSTALTPVFKRRFNNVDLASLRRRVVEIDLSSSVSDV